MKKMIVAFSLIVSMALYFISCGGPGNKNDNTSSEPTASTSDTSAATPDATKSSNPSYDPNRGEGKFHGVKVSDKLDVAMAEKGQKIYELKCSSCHKLTNERLVGPGWKDV
ncbi:MAG: cytochrome c, partial [Ginsengibacter sp.]